MHKIMQYEAGAEMEPILGQLKSHQEITITCQGIPVARLSWLDAERAAQVRSSFEELRELRKRFSVRPMALDEIQELIQTGRE